MPYVNNVYPQYFNESIIEFHRIKQTVPMKFCIYIFYYKLIYNKKNYNISVATL